MSISSRVAVGRADAWRPLAGAADRRLIMRGLQNGRLARSRFHAREKYSVSPSSAVLFCTSGAERGARTRGRRFRDFPEVLAARVTSNARGITLSVPPFDRHLAIDADRQVLGAALTNLIQNAVKFTRVRTAVTLRVEARDGRVMLAVEDACGGLPAGDPEDLFRPFEQRSVDKTGLGLAGTHKRPALWPAFCVQTWVQS